MNIIIQIPKYLVVIATQNISNIYFFYSRVVLYFNKLENFVIIFCICHEIYTIQYF